MHKSTIAFALMLVCFMVRAQSDNFDDAKTGEIPKGWTSGVTGTGTSKWAVEMDATAPSKPNVLKQSGEGTYPYCVMKDVAIKDGFVETKFKAVAGKEDQAGGIIWRFKDGDNYYITRANTLEDNVTIYRTVAGRRVAFKNLSAKVASGEWHTLRIDFKAAHFTVTFDSKVVIETDDTTFSDAGAVGVWTKADSVTLFDDFQYGGTK